MGTILAKIGEWVKAHQTGLWYVALGALTTWSAYNLGLLMAGRGAQPLQESAILAPREGIVPRPSGSEQGSAPAGPDRSDPRVVASKASSTRKYHHAWCPGAKQIKEANRLWFPSATDAEAAGYTLAANCSK